MCSMIMELGPMFVELGPALMELGPMIAKVWPAVLCVHGALPHLQSYACGDAKYIISKFAKRCESKRNFFMVIKSSPRV